MKSIELGRPRALIRFLSAVAVAGTGAAAPGCGHWTPESNWTTLEGPQSAPAALRRRALEPDDCAQVCRNRVTSCHWATLAIPASPRAPRPAPSKAHIECSCNYEGTGKPAGTYTRVAPDDLAASAEIGSEVRLSRSLCDSLCIPVVGNIVYAGTCSLSALPEPVPEPVPPTPPRPDETFVVCENHQDGSYDLLGPLPSGRVVGATWVEEPASSKAEHFARAARLEAASVAEFRRLSTELRAHGAPRRFIASAQRAARDEIVHARLMRGLAGRTKGDERARRHPTPRLKPRVVPLVELAIENATAGCVGETLGTALAHYQALNAATEGDRRAMKRLARDEARHAALAWRLFEWFDARLEPEERLRVDEAMQRALVDVKRAHAMSAQVAREIGWPTACWFHGLAGRLTRALQRA